MDVTTMLERLRCGETEVLHELIPVVYEELRKLARAHLRREGKAPLATTVLVHEAYIKLAGNRLPKYENRAHFYGIASRLMRQILVDAARARRAEKRGEALEVSLPELPDVSTPTDRSLLALDDALSHLQKVDPQKAEIIEMRYFAGMTTKECSAVTGLPSHVVRRELRFAQAWLRNEMEAANRNVSPSATASD